MIATPSHLEIINTTYPVMEHFYTLQGEGAYAGQAAYFIRLGGCDVGCHWCDVKDSWDATAHPQLTVGEMIAAASSHPGRLAVITGGEPSMHDCTILTTALHQAGFRTHIETSGSSEFSGDWDWITLSPKKFKKPVTEWLDKADELKIIIFNQSDFQWAAEYAALVHPNCKLYLQVEWDKRETLSSDITDFIMANPKWQMSIQTHKYLNIP